MVDFEKLHHQPNSEVSRWWQWCRCQPAQEGWPIDVEGGHQTKHRCQGQADKDFLWGWFNDDKGRLPKNSREKSDLLPNSFFEEGKKVFQGPHRTILGNPKHVLHLVPSPNASAKAFNVMLIYWSQCPLISDFGLFWPNVNWYNRSRNKDF